MQIQQAIAQLIERQNLQESDMLAVMQQVMTGQATQAQIAGFLVALRMKGETVDEIVAAVKVMRELASAVELSVDNAIDIVGTGGDGAKLFNVSTASTFVAAAAGCSVAKHGNRSVSSSSGAADLLESAGVNLSLTSEQVARCVEQVGVGFMFAVNHHSAMKHAIGPRKELAVRTIFNILGPMTNPAGVKRQLLGVYDRDLLLPVAEVLNKLGSEHVMVVHSSDGLDEISVADTTYVAELKGGQINEYKISPEDVGIDRSPLSQLAVDGAGESLKLIQSALTVGDKSSVAQAAADMIALNAGAAIYVAGVADTWQQGVAVAQDVLGTGQAREKMRELAAVTSQMAG